MRHEDGNPQHRDHDSQEWREAQGALGGIVDAKPGHLERLQARIAAMAERVRQPRGRMAEPALTYGFAEEDL